MYTEQTIFTDVISFVNAGLLKLNYSNWNVVQSGQPKITALKRPIIIIDMISAPRYGWQHIKEKVVNSQIVHKELFYQDLNFQLSAFKHRSATSEEETAIDVCIGLSTFFNSEAGINLIKKKGYGISKITEIRTGFFVNEEETYEQNPSFDFSLNILQEVSSFVEEISDISGRVKGV